MGARVPKHWKDTTWEQKAQEDPLFAVMTAPAMSSPGAEAFSDEQLAEFFKKGERVFKNHVAPLVALTPEADPQDTFIVEYGCGMGRILRAASAAGYRCAGIDISKTMLSHCRKLAPSVSDLYLLDAKGRSAAPGASADVVYSFAVVQHIASLAAFKRALAEMCRVLKPGGVIGIQANCEDFTGGDIDKPARTDKFERYSLHYRSGEFRPYMRHDQNNWSGVYIGERTMAKLLNKGGVRVERRYFHSPKKLRSVWFWGRKRA